MKETADEVLEVHGSEEVRTLLGPLDSNTRLIRELHGVNVLVRDGSVRLLGGPDDVRRVRDILSAALEEMRRGNGGSAGTADVARRLKDQSPVPVPGGAELPPERTAGPVQPRTDGQRRYWQAIQEKDVVIAAGPAGTGKTYMAVAAAVTAVKAGAVRRIVLTRPAVEAGEKLGFLPGDFQAKINPYLRPLYDALHDLLEASARQRYLESEVIEVCPLAYMRGRTLNDAFIILDEAQNCTVTQMLMFLTRMGRGSQVVVTGDPSQIDLPPNVKSGLGDATRRLKGVDGVGVVELTARDIVRHPVVQKIVSAYGKKS